MVIKKLRTILRLEKQSKQLKVFYFLRGCHMFVLSICCSCFYNSDMFSENQIESVEIQNNELVVKQIYRFTENIQVTLFLIQTTHGRLK